MLPEDHRPALALDVPAEPPAQRPPEKSLLREYLEALLIAIIFATFARTYVVQAFKIPSGSMEKNLLIGDHILVNKFIYGPTVSPLEQRLLPMRPVDRGDIVVFKYPQDPTRDFIKRCMGIPGDTLRLVGEDLFINGRPVDDKSYTWYAEELLEEGEFTGGRVRESFGPRTVPPESYFCMGDNRDNSNDSRFWGEVPRDYVKGRAFMVYWSFDAEQEPLDWPGFAGKLRQLGHVAGNFFTQTRWDRTFRIVR
jgi:signal peptidase I